MLLTGFPASGKIMETWKIKKKLFSRPGQIMEFEKIPKNLEKSWNLKKSDLEKSWSFVSDLKHCEANFWCAAHTFMYIVLLYIDVINQYME